MLFFSLYSYGSLFPHSQLHFHLSVSFLSTFFLITATNISILLQLQLRSNTSNHPSIPASCNSTSSTTAQLFLQLLLFSQEASPAFSLYVHGSCMFLIFSLHCRFFFPAYSMQVPHVFFFYEHINFLECSFKKMGF